MPGDLWLIGAYICHRIGQPLQDRLGGSLEGSSGLLFRSEMLTNVWGQQLGATGQSGHGRRQSLISADSR
jgi:hypothetical protein